MVQQWLRACSFVIADQSGNGVELAGTDLSQVLRIRFTVAYYTSQTPAILHARVYNLSPQTIQNIQSLASKNPPSATSIPFATSGEVVLKAGYQQNLGQVFKGQIYQLRKGYENSTDSYLDIFAADGIWAHTYDSMSTTFAKGYSAVSLWHEYNGSMSRWGVTAGDPPKGLDSNASPRGKVLFGPTRERMTELGQTYNFNWNITDGRVQALPAFSFRPGEAIVVNHTTGMIGFPEQTQEGVMLTVLLNPAIRWGTHVKINNKEVAQFLLNQLGSNANALPGQTASPKLLVSGNPRSPTWVPPLDADGNYTVLWAEHVGDTRGNDWYTKFACISIDPSAPVPVSSGVLPQITPPPRG